MQTEDRQYVEQALDGDSDAYHRLVRKYNRLAGAIAYGVLGDYQLAEDVVQDSFLKAFRSLGMLRCPERFRVWFAGIVRSRAIDILRHRRSQLGQVAKDPAVLDVAADPVQASELLIKEEQRQRVLDAISDLPDSDRQVLVLKHMEGLSYKEIAEITGTTVSAVESRLFRARQALKRLITHLMK